MNSAGELTLREPHRFPGLALVLAISVALHLLLLWALSDIRRDDGPRPETEPRTLHLTLAPPPSANETAASADAAAAHATTTEDVTPKQPQQPPPAIQKPRPARQRPTSSDKQSPPESVPSAARLIATAKEVTRKMATQDQKAWTPGHGHRTESALEAAFKPQKEPPGVRQLADGTVRVVTEYGLVYCVSAAEDWRILGPEEIPPLNKICN